MFDKTEFNYYGKDGYDMINKRTYLGVETLKWSEIRKQYPDKCVLVEAISAYSKDNKRMIDEMSVLEEHNSSTDAWSSYKKLHLEFPERELYIFHTRNAQIEVEEQRFTGVRGRV